MRTSSTHRRLVAALSASTLALVFSLGSPAFGGEKSQAGSKGGPTKTERPSTSGTDNDSAPDTEPDAAPPEGDNYHPSGKDRHEDKGPQGHSTSDPDGMENGGPDKPFEGDDGSGGNDTFDQDGNNGCGNDDDFEDDNNGNCGGKPKPSTPPTEVGGTSTEKCPKGQTMVEGGTAPKDCKTPEITVKETGNSVILGGVTETPGAVLDNDVKAAAVASDEATVLGVQFERTSPAAVAAEVAAASATTPAASVLGAALARTGMSFTMLALATALGLLAIGFALKRAGRTQSDF